MAQKLIALIFCDATAKAPDGKTTIYGVFDIIHCDGFPLRYRQFSIYWKIYSDELGTLTIQIEKPDGSRLLTTNPIELRENILGKHEGIHSLGGVEFPIEGDYRVVLLFNDTEEIGSQVLRVTLE